MMLKFDRKSFNILFHVKVDIKNNISIGHGPSLTLGTNTISSVREVQNIMMQLVKIKRADGSSLMMKLTETPTTHKMMTL